jgi:uncharacterized membrane protein YphA (DoxX/SURF4 family)
MKILRTLFRIIVGLVFIYSGFVKGIDPLGTVYRMDDYFQVFSMPFFSSFSLFLTIFLCTIEFTIGVSLLFNLWIRKTVWILMPMMIFFTILTFFDAVYNLVPDCGCFGDALKITNVQTFIKNLVLMAMVVPLFLWRKYFRNPLSVKSEIALIFVTIIAFSSLSVYCYRHLPLMDFMAWKIGNKINKKENNPVIFYVTYKNKLTGEEKEYIAPNYPWNDSVWLSQWIFKSQRVVDTNKDNSLVLRIEDEFGGDFTSSIIDNVDFHFILVSHDLKKTEVEGFHKILPFFKKAYADNYSFVCLTNASPAEIKQFKIANGTAFDYYTAVDVVLKTMVRSNPGLILVRDGVVIDKWAFRDFPSYEDVKLR